MSIPRHVFQQTVASLLAPLEPLLSEGAVSEIIINGYQQIYVEKSGRLHLTSQRFDSEHALMSALRNLAQFVGREVDVLHPILEARLPDGSRVEAVIPPAAPGGPIVCIRRFRPNQLTLTELMEVGALCEEAASLLEAAVERRDNLIVAGGSGSGKTSLLSALVSLAQPDERIVVIEDSLELRVDLPHVVQLEAQPADSRARGEVTVRDLFRATLRLRADRIVIGEIRGGEALDLIQAMTSGHRGCLSTVHATLPLDTLSRLETMALMSNVDIPITVLRAQIASGVDTIVQVSRNSNGLRCVTHIARVVGHDPERGYRVTNLFEQRAGAGGGR